VWRGKSKNIVNFDFLAKQISDDFQSIVNDLSIATIFSTKKKSDDQETAIGNGCDILVATPDRLKEFIDDEKVDITEIKHVVLDEIDLMLDSPVIDDIKKILKSVFVSGNHWRC
jgi:superfamily II DNA/RNA helicase